MTSLGKGALLLLFSYAIFFITGYGIYFGLARILTLEDFGTYGVIIALVSVVTVVFGDSARQIVSKFASQAPKAHLRSLALHSLRVFFIAGLVLSVIFFLASGLLALLLNDSSLTPLIQFSSILILLQLEFSVLVGFLNGLHSFKRQAFLESSYYVLKLAFVLALPLLGFGLFGAIGGFIIAVLAALALGFLACFKSLFSKGKSASRLKAKNFLHFSIGVFLTTLALHLLNNLDLFFAKALSPSGSSGILAGYYIAASTIARMPQVFGIALAGVLFPLVVKSFSKRRDFALRQARNAFQYALMALAFFAAFFLANPGEVLLLAFSPEFLPAVPALEALLFGASIYSLFFLLVVSMMAVGKPFRAFSIALAVLALQFLLTFFLAPLGLFGIAAALSISLLAGFFLALLVFQKTAGFLPDFGKAFKTLACGLLVFAVSKALAFEGIGLFFEFLIAACLFALLLHLLKVFSINDWKHALRLLGNQP